MGVFGDWARKYYEAGLPVIPCHEKKPIVGLDWTKWCDFMPSEDVFEEWEKSFSHADQIGMLLGPSSGIAIFDFDYEFDPKKCTIDEKKFKRDAENIEKQIIAILPQTFCIKRGKKGWTRFYKMSGELRNMQCDRNGVRLFDFMCKGKQTIIPPSKYGHGLDIHYKWIGPEIQDCMADMPFITTDIVDEIKFLFDEPNKINQQTRHFKLFSWALNVSKVESSDEKIAADMVAYDKAINEKPYLSDPKHHRSADAISNAMQWLKRIRKFNSEKQGKSKIQAVNSDGWNYFFKNSVGEVRKDKLSGNLFSRKTEKHDWVPIETLEDVLKAYANDRCMKKEDVKIELARYCFEEEKKDFLCEIKQPDGHDWVFELTKAIISPEFSHAEISDIFKHWGTCVFARAESSNVQNRCLILKGKQGLGKDTFIKELFKSFEPYYSQIAPPDTNKDWFEIISRLYICHIEEFDQTAKVDVAFLKSLITQPSVFFRESYGRAPTKKNTPVSFISSVNPDDFFRDTTGNRRFIVIPVDDIDRSYAKGKSFEVVAQLYAMHKAHGVYRLPDALEKKITAYVNGLTPESNDIVIEEIWRERMARISANQVDGRVGQDIASGIFLDIARSVGVSPQKVRRTLKSKGYQHRTMSGRYWTWQPICIEGANLAKKH